MTHSGGQPHAVGDRGQRYEIRATGWPRTEKTTIGFWVDRNSAYRAAFGFKKAPGCSAVEIFDRQENIVIDFQ